MIRTSYLKFKVSSFVLLNNLLEGHLFLSSSLSNENDFS